MHKTRNLFSAKTAQKGSGFLILRCFFVQLGVDEEVAAEDACKAEHILSEQTLEKIREYALLHDAQDSVK